MPVIAYLDCNGVVQWAAADNDSITKDDNIIWCSVEEDVYQAHKDNNDNLIVSGVFTPNHIPVPETEPPYDELRQAAILEKWSMESQLEALTEAAESPARPEKLTALLADIQEVKEQYPKPEEA